MQLSVCVSCTILVGSSYRGDVIFVIRDMDILKPTHATFETRSFSPKQISQSYQPHLCQTSPHNLSQMRDSVKQPCRSSLNLSMSYTLGCVFYLMHYCSLQVCGSSGSMLFQPFGCTSVPSEEWKFTHTTGQVSDPFYILNVQLTLPGLQSAMKKECLD